MLKRASKLAPMSSKRRKELADMGSECDGTGSCFRCYEGMEVDE